MPRPAAAIAIALAAAGAGCGNVLMPTPVGFDRAGADPFAATAPSERGPEVQVLVATNRKLHPSAPAGERFGTERSQELGLGTMAVRIGDGDLSWDRLVELSREDDRASNPPVALRDVEAFGAVWPGPASLDPDPASRKPSADRFLAAVDAALERSGSRQLYLYVHGFNTTVAGNAAVAASMFHFMGRAGALVQFEWPSKGSVWAYQADKNAAAASVRAFRHLLALVGTRTKADRVHVLAHSAGAPIALEAIHELRLMRTGQPVEQARDSLRLGRLVLVAPDMDLGEFRDCVADGTTALPQRVTIYVSSRDKALDFAAWMSDFARLGQPLQALKPSQIEFLEDDANVDIVDVAGGEERVGSWLGHSYFHEDPWASTDVLLTLVSGAHPLDRGLQRDGRQKTYAFGPEYPDRAREAARRIAARAAGGPGGPAASPSQAPSPVPASDPELAPVP
jgi:esterase/lipase superfamily enzyme